MHKFTIGMAALALGSLVQAEIASAQAAAPDCIADTDVSALFVYAVPSALQAAGNTCTPELSGRGFMATGAAAMIAKYGTFKEQNWPGAKRAIIKFAKAKDSEKPAGAGNQQTNGDLDTYALFDQLPDDVVRPLVDALILQLVAQEIKPKNCKDIERVASALAPLEPDEAGNLVATLVSVAGVKEPRICEHQD